MVGVVQFWLEYFQVANLEPGGAKGTSKFIDIGGLVHFFLVSVSSNSISAEICDSFIPPIPLIFHTMAFSLALYLAFPFMQMSCTPLVLRGVGILISNFWANRLGLKLDLTTTLTSSLERPTSLTRGITLKGREMSLVVRYLMSSCSPSGGMKLMLCSVSNLESLTHWWNWQSSIAMADLVLDSSVDLPLLSITILSLIPNLHSGIPDR